MLFNSTAFLLVFLPIALAGFHVLRRFGSRQSLFIWVAGMSMVFYGVWNPAYVPLLLGSITANYLIANHGFDRIAHSEKRRLLLIAGIGLNLALLGYFKYTIFFLGTLADIGLAELRVGDIILPLAISFFTFQQISYLVDTYKGGAKASSWWEYAFFVSFFPQLIAGPIVRFEEVKAQYDGDAFGRFSKSGLALGLLIFTMGLAQKTLLADNLASLATPVFTSNADGIAVSTVQAWLASLAYSFQIYFDFSGYSNMAIGLGLMFGLKLPQNFDSPYRATSIVDFWRRWHMTLSRFLRDYLYIPLGGNRLGEYRQFANMVVVMLLGGLWHGAGWTFVLWGGAHGILLGATHWAQRNERLQQLQPPRTVAIATTFLFVLFTWVMFRSGSVVEFGTMTRSMLGMNQTGAELLTQLPALATLAVIAAVALVLSSVIPNAHELMTRWEKTGLGLRERVLVPWACGIGASTCIIGIFLGTYSEFIYFQF